MRRHALIVMLDTPLDGGIDMAVPQYARNVKPIEVRKARADDSPAISRTLARAFYADPVFEWAIPNDLRRRNVLPSLFLSFTEALEHHRATYVAGNWAGAALWVPPEQPPVAPEDEEAFDAQLGALLDDDELERVGELSAIMAAEHPHAPHMYLWFLGVHPAWQGSGIGSTLLDRVLAQLDVQGTAAYLEATSANNVRLYERHGFQATAAIIGHGGPPLWKMWREPQTRRR
jgi:ribosomal protein S18 acetylase RimI-like enzyme